MKRSTRLRAAFLGSKNKTHCRRGTYLQYHHDGSTKEDNGRQRGKITNQVGIVRAVILQVGGLHAVRRMLDAVKTTPEHALTLTPSELRSIGELTNDLDLERAGYVDTLRLPAHPSLHGEQQPYSWPQL